MQGAAYPEFHLIESALPGGGEYDDPSELHGVLSALIATGGVAGDAWLRQLVGTGLDPAGDTERVLRHLYVATLAQLEDEDLGFYPLLPDDDEELSARTRSLGNWCGGFLYGLGLRGISGENLDDDETAAFVRDLGEIARVSVVPGDSLDAEDADFAEIVEYVRMGVILVATQFKWPASESRMH